MARFVFLLLCFSVFSVLCVNGRSFFRMGRSWDTKGIKSERYYSRSDLPPDQWFVQKLDHFNDADARTWNQRYFVNDTFYEPGGPVFVNIGGEGPADPIWMVEGQWIKWAQEFKALCFQVEHRYYGDSHPTSDLSVKNLQYLSSEQALADLADFASSIGSQYNVQDAKWIFFGGSYSGSLAAWFRLKYPQFAYASVATSAPLLAEIDFEEYLGVVEESLANYSSTCNPTITEAVNQIDTLLNDEEGWNTLTEKFRLCGALDGTIADDVTNLYSLLAGNFEGVVQYNKDNRAFEGAKATNITIETICGIMDDESIGEEIDRYAAVNSLLLDAYSTSCLDFQYTSYINFLRAIAWDLNKSGARQWTYQTCTEFGFYQSSDLAGQPFGNKFPIEFWVKQCADIYGPRFNETLLSASVNETNNQYGGLNYKGTKVIFPNGSIDPWHALGILTDLNSEATAVYIQGTAHCADMYPDSPDDPPQLIEARETIRQQIETWLSE